ncbi:acyltransferase family protein [Nitratireductor luteus]|uniref:acyltransferase family protein n=1 Tax=Nitratireductor luteus TaxID=2976980 RepID=UPI00223F8D22|nr:acyltransferase [Nitratireductor luteus]
MAAHERGVEHGGTEEPRPGAGEILYSVQYLRAAAAYLVVLFHLTASLGGETKQATGFAVGAIGVDIFFILSGFVMALIVDRSPRIDNRFLIRRLARIVPLYHLMTLALFMVVLSAPSLLNTARADFAHLASSLLFLPYDSPGGGNHPILTLGWTLNYEIFFYVLIALCVRLFHDRTLLSVVALLCGLAALGTMLGSNTLVARFYLDPIILEFGIGILVYRYIYREQGGPRVGVYWLALFTGLLILLLRYDITSQDWRFIAFGIPASLIVAGGVKTLNFRVEWLRRLGDWSFSTYLIHVYVIQLAVKLVLPALAPSMMTPLPLALIVLPVTILASAILYRHVEMPAMSWVLHVTGSRRRQAAPAT